jgi:hypothetical protein
MNKLILAFLPLATACISANLSDTVADTESMSFPVPVVASTPHITCDLGGPVFETTQTSPPFNLSDFFTQLDKHGTLTVNFTNNSLTGDLSSFKHATLTLLDSAGNSQPLSDTDFTPVNGVVELPLLLTSAQLVATLATGPVNVVVDLQSCLPANTSGSLTVNYTLGAKASFAYSK